MQEAFKRRGTAKHAVNTSQPPAINYCTGLLNAEFLFGMSGVRLLLVNLESMTAKPRPCGGKKDCYEALRHTIGGVSQGKVLALGRVSDS